MRSPLLYSEIRKAKTGWEYGREGGNKKYIQKFGAETYGNIEKNDFKVDLTEIGCGGWK